MEFELKARSLNLLHRTANGDGELPLTTLFIILLSQPKHESALMHGCAVRREKVIFDARDLCDTFLGRERLYIRTLNRARSVSLHSKELLFIVIIYRTYSSSFCYYNKEPSISHGFDQVEYSVPSSHPSHC